MITIYTTSSCSSCRKAKKWMDEFKIPYKEVNLFVRHLSREELMDILQRTENGMEDIVSTRSNVIQNGKINFDALTMNEAIEFLLENPSAIRRPIIIDDRHFQVGYNEDEIRAFIPKELRDICCDICDERGDCPVHNQAEVSYEASTSNL